MLPGKQDDSSFFTRMEPIYTNGSLNILLYKENAIKKASEAEEFKVSSCHMTEARIWINPGKPDQRAGMLFPQSLLSPISKALLHNNLIS